MSDVAVAALDAVGIGAVLLLLGVPLAVSPAVLSFLAVRAVTDHAVQGCRTPAPDAEPDDLAPGDPYPDDTPSDIDAQEPATRSRHRHDRSTRRRGNPRHQAQESADLLLPRVGSSTAS